MLQEEPDDEVTMFDGASLLGSGKNRRLNKRRGLNTFALCGAFFGVVSIDLCLFVLSGLQFLALIFFGALWFSYCILMVTLAEFRGSSLVKMWLFTTTIFSV